PILQGDEGEGRILADAREAETENGDDAIDRLLRHEDLLDVANDVEGAAGARVGGRLQVDDQVALILVRQKGGRQAHVCPPEADQQGKIDQHEADRKSTRLNSSHVKISYAVFCLKKKRQKT